MSKFNDEDLARQVVDFLAGTAIPCSVDHVAEHFALSWGTARAILLNLAIQGRLKQQKTTSGLIFWVDKEVLAK